VKRLVSWRRGIAAIALLLCQSCSHLASLSFPPPVDSAHAVPVQTFHFRDGGDTIYFALDKSMQPISAKARTYVFVIGGSGCTSMRYFLPGYFRGLEGESGGMRIFMLHKRHIAENTWGRLGGCSDAFTRADHPSRWLADQEEFIRAQLALAREQQRYPERVALVGISEGGDIVPALAQRIAAITHAAILANGGMDAIDAYRLQLRKHGVNDTVTPALDHAPADPDAVDPALGGRTWRYWSELSRLKQSDALLSLSIPVFIAMGEDDDTVPIASAWHARERFAAAGKSNLTLITYPGADHALSDRSGSHLADAWHALDLWLERK
jgi:pimeloyl-ACP methyl ester carboxylesterase